MFKFSLNIWKLPASPLLFLNKKLRSVVEILRFWKKIRKKSDSLFFSSIVVRES